MKKLISILIASAMVLSMAVICAAEDEPEAFATVEALQFDIEPEIDGKVSVDEWGQPTVAHIKYPENPQTDVSKDDQTDVEFTIWFRYTYDGFYIAAQTPDSSPCNDNVDGAQIWNGDCLQMRLDPYGCTEDQGLFASASRDANYSEDYQEFAFAYSPDDGECYSYCWHGIMSGLALQSEGGRYGASNDGTTTTYELFIPWDELLEDAPHAGNSYGIAAALLTATQGENDNKWQNWLEWGSGVINNRDDNICGTNRLILSTSTVFGGATLTDPNPAGETTTRAPIPEAEGEYVPVDFTKLSSPHDIHFSQNDDGSVTFTFDDSNDPYITLNISSQIKIKAEDYPYFAMVLTSNYGYAIGEIFYCCSDGVGDYTGGYSRQFEYYEAEGKQVATVDLEDANGYEGYVLKLRFDALDGGTSDPDETEITVYKAGFFKSYDDAVLFRVNGEAEPNLDPDYLAEVVDTPATDTDKQTDPVTTEAEATTAADVTEAEPATTDGTTTAPEKTTEKKNNTWIIYAAIGVAVAAAAAVAVILISKKKKK